MPLLRPLIAVALATATGLSVPADAEAHPVCAEVYLHRQGTTARDYVVGPKTCVPGSDLGFPLLIDGRTGHQQNVPILPPGTPNGAGVGYWIPAP